MKTPEQWMEIMNKRGAVTQPAGTLKLIADIQHDALNNFHSGDRDNTGLNRRGLLSAAPTSPE